MPIIQNRDVKYPYKQYIYIYILFTSTLGQKQLCPSGYIDVRSRSFCVENETAQVRILAFFFFLFFVVVCFFFYILSVYVWKCDEEFVHFLHIVAKSPSAFL